MWSRKDLKGSWCNTKCESTAEMFQSYQDRRFFLLRNNFALSKEIPFGEWDLAECFFLCVSWFLGQKLWTSYRNTANKSCNLLHVGNQIILRDPFDSKSFAASWNLLLLAWTALDSYACLDPLAILRQISIEVNTASFNNTCNRRQLGCCESTAWYIHV